MTYFLGLDVCWEMESFPKRGTSVRTKSCFWFVEDGHIDDELSKFDTIRTWLQPEKNQSKVVENLPGPWIVKSSCSNGKKMPKRCQNSSTRPFESVRGKLIFRQIVPKFSQRLSRGAFDCFSFKSQNNFQCVLDSFFPALSDVFVTTFGVIRLWIAFDILVLVT